MKRFYIAVIFLMTVLCVRAQQYTATEGLLHVPSADIDTAGAMRVGIHLIPETMMPDGMAVDGEKYNSASYYIGVSLFNWLEVSFVEVMWKFHRDLDPSQPVGFYSKDRHLSAKLRLLKEGKYWPSVAVGSDELFGSGEDGKSYSDNFQNYYATVTKHIDIGGYDIGANLTYRKWKRDYMKKYNSLVGGITLRPAFYKPLRLIAEWDGCEVNIGADSRVTIPLGKLRPFLLLQASLLDCKHFFGGACIGIPLK